jgi:hypothetical protein
MTDRIVRLPVRGRARATLPRSQYEQLRLQDSANLFQALTVVTEARDAFLKFAEGTQKPDVFAVFMHLAHTMGQAGAEISETMHRNGHDDPPRCA